MVERGETASGPLSAPTFVLFVFFFFVFVLLQRLRVMRERDSRLWSYCCTATSRTQIMLYWLMEFHDNAVLFSISPPVNVAVIIVCVLTPWPPSSVLVLLLLSSSVPLNVLRVRFCGIDDRPPLLSAHIAVNAYLKLCATKRFTSIFCRFLNGFLHCILGW